MYNSSLCEHSGFGSFLIGCHKVLFCSQLNQSSFMLFNKPISKSFIFYDGAPILRFDTIFKKLGKDWGEVNPVTRTIPDKKRYTRKQKHKNSYMEEKCE